MIGIMYLFLTCMLALNVSKEVLDAFFIVNEGLKATTENFAKKNEVIYDAFDKSYNENKVKVEPWKLKADSVRQAADKLVLRIQQLKDTIVKTADQLPDTTTSIFLEKLNERVPLERGVSSKDNTDAPAQIMVGATGKGQGKVLKGQIEEFRTMLLGMVPSNSESLRKSIEKGLSTQDPPAEEGAIHTWESHNFEHLPLVAVVTIMTQLQAAVRNSESDVITYLLNQIDAASFKFNKLEATVIANSNYVMAGSEYSAQIFLAASDSTATPIVQLGKVDSVKTNGVWTYSLRGDGKIVPVDPKKKVSVYSVKTGATGEQKYEGVIKIKQPGTDDFVVKPFRSSFIVAQPSLVVSPSKMNVFYVGVDNPVEISVPGVPSSQLKASMSNGSLSQSKEGYVARLKVPGKVTISVTANNKPMGSKEFRVKTVPSPVAEVNNQRGGTISIPVLQAQRNVVAKMENFDFDLKFNVTSFTISTRTKDGFIIDKRSDSDKINSEQKQLLAGLTRGQKIYFEEIKAKGPDGTERDLGAISFKCQ